jgi:hypothetical protein
VALVLPRRLAPVLPTTYSPKDLTLAKAHAKHEHFGFPYHTFVHCKGFAPAAPRRARTCISVSFSGQPLSRPLRILGLVGHYPTNSLIRRQLILRHEFQRKNIPVFFSYQALHSVSRDYSWPKGRLLTCYWAICRCHKDPWLAWLIRIQIAATSRRINGYWLLVALL